MNYSFFFKLFSRIFRIFFNFKNDDIKLTELNKLFYLGGFDFVATSVNDFNLITRQNSDFILKKTFQDSIKFAEKMLILQLQNVIANAIANAKCKHFSF